MLSRVLGGPRLQANVSSGFLRVIYSSRYIDSGGRASIEEYTAIWDTATSTWKDSQNLGNFFIIAAGAGDPVPPSVTFVESFVYPGGNLRTQSWTGQPIVNNGNDFDYASAPAGASFVTSPPLSLTQLEAANTAAQAIIAGGLLPATEAIAGRIRLAAIAEAVAGIVTDKAVTPVGLKSARAPDLKNTGNFDNARAYEQNELASDPVTGWSYRATGAIASGQTFPSANWQLWSMADAPTSFEVSPSITHPNDLDAHGLEIVRDRASRLELGQRNILQDKGRYIPITVSPFGTGAFQNGVFANNGSNGTAITGVDEFIHGNTNTAAGPAGATPTTQAIWELIEAIRNYQSSVGLTPRSRTLGVRFRMAKVTSLVASTVFFSAGNGIWGEGPDGFITVAAWIRAVGGSLTFAATTRADGRSSIFMNGRDDDARITGGNSTILTPADGFVHIALQFGCVGGYTIAAEAISSLIGTSIEHALPVAYSGAIQPPVHTSPVF
jgi:hypothetical protein